MKRVAPPPPSPSNHTRSPSDSLIGKLGLGRLVIPPGEPPTLRKTSIPTTPPVAVPHQSITYQSSAPGFNLLGNIMNNSSNTSNSSPASLPSPVISSQPIVSNGNKSFAVPIDVDSYKVVQISCISDQLVKVCKF